MLKPPVISEIQGGKSHGWQKVYYFPLQKHLMELAVSIWKLLHLFDPCADSEDSYLYCFNIELTIQIYLFFLSPSFPTAPWADCANWSSISKLSCTW